MGQTAATYTATTNGTYSVVIFNGTCSASASNTSIIIVNATPTGSISPANVILCPGAAQLLTATGGVSYQWYLNNVSISGAVSSTYTATVAGNYKAELFSQNGCKGNAANTATVNLFSKPIPDFQYNVSCQNEITSFTNNSTTINSGNISWKWNFGDNSFATSFAPTHMYTLAGPFTVTLVAASANCPLLSDSVKKTITIYPTVTGIKYSTVRIVKNVPTTLSARNIGQQYLWQPSSNLNNPIIRTPMVNTNSDITYRIKITTPGGCTTVDTLLVQAFDKTEVFVPKAFTPNTNNANDILRPLTVNIPVINYFRVYNRWGQLMFQTQSAGEGWNGVYKNALQSSDTYTWIFEGKDTDGNIIKANGKSILIR